MSDTAYARMKQMGELAYNRELAGRAQAWISAHPTQSLGIALGYLRQYYFPPEWLWHIYSDRSRSTWVKALSHWLISARSEEHTYELQSLMSTPYAFFCLN